MPKSQEEIDRLSEFIMGEVPGEPSQSEGAIDTIIRVYWEMKERIEAGERLMEKIARSIKDHEAGD